MSNHLIKMSHRITHNFAISEVKYDLKRKERVNNIFTTLMPTGRKKI